MTTGIYDNCYSCWNSCPADAGNKGVCLFSALADADGLRLARNTVITNIDVVNTCREISTGSIAHCNVIAAGCVAQERIRAVSRIIAAIGKLIRRSKQGLIAGRSVIAAALIADQGPVSNSGVVTTGAGTVIATKERLVTESGIKTTRRVVTKRIVTGRRIANPLRVLKHTRISNRDIFGAGSIADERFLTERGIKAAGGVAN